MATQISLRPNHMQVTSYSQWQTEGTILVVWAKFHAQWAL